MKPHAELPDVPGIRGSSRPIGVFDSGIGGLTVAAALRRLLPSEPIHYIGDTARVPYGGKSQATIERYSVEISHRLMADHAKIVVVACNTASALAIPKLHQTLEVPVTGVILPGAKAAVAASTHGRVGVIGTRGTIRSKAYEKAIHALAPEIEVFSHACPMLVPAIEEGWLDDPVTDGIIARYLEPLVDSGIDTLVLGCTHYPLLKPALARYLGGSVTLVDSAENCALAVRDLLRQHGLMAPEEQEGTLDVTLTDPPEQFLAIAEKALHLKVGHVRIAEELAAGV